MYLNFLENSLIPDVSNVWLMFCLASEASELTFVGYGKSRNVGSLILGGGVLHGSPNPDPISDQKMSFSRPVFRPDL